MSSFCAAIAVDMYYELGAAYIWLLFWQSNEHDMDRYRGTVLRYRRYWHIWLECISLGLVTVCIAGQWLRIWQEGKGMEMETETARLLRCASNEYVNKEQSMLARWSSFLCGIESLLAYAA